MAFKVDDMASSVGQVDDDDDEYSSDNAPMTLSLDESDNADSDAEEWLAEDGGTFRRMNTHLDEPRQKMVDAAFEMQSLQVGSSSQITNTVLHRIGSPSSSEGQSPFSRTKKVRRYEEEPLHHGGSHEDAALARRARHHNSIPPVQPSSSATTTASTGASASMDGWTTASSGSAAIYDWATTPHPAHKRRESPPSRKGSRQQPPRSG